MSRELFGTDGVRALAGEYPLDDAGCLAIGRAVGTQFAEAGQQIVIACDTRESSQHIVETISAGLQAVGANVTFAGIMPTPGLAYITAQHPEFVAGVMITASHNPFEYNGVKVFTSAGGKLPDEVEEQLNTKIEAGVPDRNTGTFTKLDLISEYESFLTSTADGLRLDTLKIVVDTANGAASGIGQQIFEELGAEVIGLGNTPNGRNINIRCGATDTQALRDTVLEHQADIGIAVDGDADRLIMVDALGRECNGDYLLYLLAVANGYNQVVATVMSNLGLEQALANKEISLDRTAVGDRYVLERLLQADYKIGGEQSGHIILPKLSTTGDGLLAAVQVLKAIAQSGRALSEWRDDIAMLPQALVNFYIADKTKLNSPEVTEYVQVKTTELGSAGRILVRPSGTEPLARVMVEAPNANDLAQEMATHIAELVQ